MNQMIFQRDRAIKKIKAEDAVESGRDYVKSVSQRRFSCETIFANTWIMDDRQEPPRLISVGKKQHSR